MKMKFARLKGLAGLATGVLLAASAPAQSLTFVTAAPTPGTSDIFNFTGALDDSGNVSDGNVYADGAGNDGFTYIANNRPSMGQTFTTGATAGKVTAIWIRQVGYTNDPALTYWSYASGSAETFRITSPSQVNSAGFVLDTESYTITGAEPNNPGGFNFSATGTGIWLRFGLTNVVTLTPNTTYGFDVTGIGGDFFETWGTSNNVYAGGAAYTGSTGGGLDNTMNTLVGDRAFLVEINGGTFAPPPIIKPSVTNQPANVMVPLGANAVLTAGYGGTAPFTYQWYFNTNTLLVNQTNASLTVAGTTAGSVGAYSVIVSNTSGTATSAIARVAIILPTVTTNIVFSTSSGSILDVNGNGIGLNTRLAGTGSALPTDDPDLFLDTADGVLEIASPTCDFNGQLAMSSAEAVGFNLSSLGFSGNQDFVITGFITNAVVGQNYDQAGIFVGTASTNFVRDGIIYNSDFTADPGSYGVGNQNGFDIGINTAATPNGEMAATIARASGVWSMSVNGMNVTPNASLTYLNGPTDMTAGVFALNTSGTQNTATVNSISASLFTGPRLVAAKTGSNLTLTWNVVSSGLLSNTNLANPNGWTPVTGATTSPFVTPIPKTGNLFYKIAP